MTKIYELAEIVRSKNAGPVTLVLDVMFRDTESYEHVKRFGILSPSVIADLYGIPEEHIQIEHSDAGRGIKVTVPRPIVAGSVGETDLYACQQYVPLLALDIPE